MRSGRQSVFILRTKRPIGARIGSGLWRPEIEFYRLASAGRRISKALFNICESAEIPLNEYLSVYQIRAPLTSATKN